MGCEFWLLVPGIRHRWWGKPPAVASYAITKTIKDRPDDSGSGRHWEPKEAFHAGGCTARLARIPAHPFGGPSGLARRRR